VPSGLEDLSSARTPSTSFVGRRDELARLRTLLGGGRLVTITGPGGSGKTRLAEELAAQLSRSFDARVAVAYLAGVGAAGDVGGVVMASVGLRGGGEPLAALVEFLGRQRLLLVLDNCEHVRDAAAELTARLLDTCSSVTVLATSRRPLLVPGEQLFPIEGLSDEAGIALFTDRVRLASPSFVLGDAYRSRAVELCARLDGMPLAIELAAARLRHIGLPELVERITGRLTDLGSPDSVAPERQRTLRGAIEWSHDLLEEPQRVLWRRLSIFEGGFTLSAAEAVAPFPPVGAADVEPILSELVDRSMVTFDVSSGRYRLIEALREFGLERLAEAAEDATAAGHHRAWMLSRAVDLGRDWWGPDQARALDEMSADAANLRAALESSRAAGAGEDGLRIATASLWYWMTRASHGEAEHWLVPLLEHAAAPELGARANVAVGWIATLSARLDAGRRYLARAEKLALEAGEPTITAYVRVVTGMLRIAEGDFDAAGALAHAVLDDSAADAMCRSWAMIEVGIVALLTGDLGECVRVSREAIETCRAVGEVWTRVPHLHLLAAATWRLGDPAGAAGLLLDALRFSRRLDDIWNRAYSMEGLAWVTADLGHDERAAQLLGISAACWAYAGSSLMAPWQVFHDNTAAELRRRLGEGRLSRQIEAGMALDPVRALSFALEDTTAAPDNRAVSGGPGTTTRVSRRETEVAALVAEGRGNREIAERLFLSPRTVETHVQHLMDKLDVSSRAEIAAWYARQGNRGAAE
jgi:non-specific serine/threonine protein kinase